MDKPEYSVIRSTRKTLSVQITREGELVVRAPYRVSQSQISDFVKNHQIWIEKHLENTRREFERKQSFTFADGQHIHIFGKEIAIRTDHYINNVQVIESALLIPHDIPLCSRDHAIFQFLSGQASIYLKKRVQTFAPRMGVLPQSVTVTKANTRWGSCSGKNRVCFSYKLICLPPELIDYIVVHELAHIIEHNHSPGFYAQIAQILPDYKRYQNELKAFQKLLAF